MHGCLSCLSLTGFIERSPLTAVLVVSPRSLLTPALFSKTRTTYYLLVVAETVQKFHRLLSIFQKTMFKKNIYRVCSDGRTRVFSPGLKPLHFPQQEGVAVYRLHCPTPCYRTRIQNFRLLVDFHRIYFSKFPTEALALFSDGTHEKNPPGVRTPARTYCM